MRKLFEVRVEVFLKSLVHDPESERIERVMQQFSVCEVSNVRAGKMFLFWVEAETKEEAEKYGQEIGDRLLANPQLENFSCEVMQERQQR